MDKFRGLNNVSDPLRLDLSWLRQADNCIVTDRGQLTRTAGYTLRLAQPGSTGVYVTEDLQRFYFVAAGELLQLNPDFSTVVLATGLSVDAPMEFVEVNGLVYYTNGVDRGMIQDGRAQLWGIPAPVSPVLQVGSGLLKVGTYQVTCTHVDARGIESGSGEVASVHVNDGSSIAVSAVPLLPGLTTNVYVTPRDGSVFQLLAEDVTTTVTYDCPPDALGMELAFWNMDVPRGTLPAFYAGQMYVAEYYPNSDSTVIWASQPLGYHHFDYGDDALIVPGRVWQNQGFDDGLLIGTERQIMLFNGEKLSVLADYGTVVGSHAQEVDGTLYFWTLRGLCSAMPFKNLTEKVVSVAPGRNAGGMIVEQAGFRRYVVALQKGSDPAFNRRG